MNDVPHFKQKQQDRATVDHMTTTRKRKFNSGSGQNANLLALNGPQKTTTSQSCVKSNNIEPIRDRKTVLVTGDKNNQRNSWLPRNN